MNSKSKSQTGAIKSGISQDFKNKGSDEKAKNSNLIEFGADENA